MYLILCFMLKLSILMILNTAVLNSIATSWQIIEIGFFFVLLHYFIIFKLDDMKLIKIVHSIRFYQ